MIPNIETKSNEEITAFQEKKLREALGYLKANSPFYQRRFKMFGIKACELNSLDDLRKIPVTTKDDLQNFNDEFLCVPKSRIIDYVTTSGTSGLPVTFALTDSDLERLAYNEAISLACSGITKHDTIQLMTTLDRRFMAGLAYFLGSRKLGASIIRVGSGIPELQWDSIHKFKPGVLICVPSFLLKLIDYAKKNDIDINGCGVRSAICIGEPIRNEDLTTNALALKIAKHWDLELFSTYASTEMGTAFNECEQHQGGHHHPDLIIAELLDENNNTVPHGEPGELTITTLGIEGMPLLRFKTGDIVRSYTDPCPCQRNTMRLGPVIGRTHQMIKFKGTTIYPPAIQNLLETFEQIEDYVIEISTNAIGTDEITFKIAPLNISEFYLNSIKEHFKAKLRVTPAIQLLDLSRIRNLQALKSGRKLIKVLDKR